MIKISYKVDIPMVVKNDVHYCCKEDAEARNALYCIGFKQLLDDYERRKIEDNMYLREEIELVKSRLIPLDDIRYEVIKNWCYEDLVKIGDELELILFLLDLKRFCDCINCNKEVEKDFKQYKQSIKRIHKKVLHLQKMKVKELPLAVQTLIKEFGGTIEN